jgi:hypothetical protein
MLPVDAELGNPNLLPEQLRTTQVTILDPDVAARSAGALLQGAALAAGQWESMLRRTIGAHWPIRKPRLNPGNLVSHGISDHPARIVFGIFFELNSISPLA